MTYDVVVPARNAERTLATTLAGLSAQVSRPRQVLVVDDGSDDATAAIARDCGVTCVSTEGVGLASAQNVGLEYVRSDFVAFVDADDIWAPSAGLILQASLRGNAGLAAISGRAQTFTELDDQVALLERSRGLPTAFSAIRMVTERELWRRNCCTKSATMFRTEAVRGAGGYRVLPSAEDYDLLLRLVANGGSIAVTDADLCLRQVSASTMTANSERMLEGELSAVTHFSEMSAGRGRGRCWALQRRKAVAYARTVVRHAQYHGSLATVPAAPWGGAGADALTRVLRGRLGQLGSQVYLTARTTDRAADGH